MDDTSARRADAGLSLLFATGERPDIEALRAAVTACQAQAVITRVDAEAGTAELILAGLMFEADGLAPALALPTASSADRHGFAPAVELVGMEAVRVFPGHPLSGGLSLQPVVRAMLALCAELSIALPARAVHWHPADIVVEPQTFSRSVLAWLAGGLFPASSLVALSALADGSVVSRGLAHFVGQEVSLRGSGDIAGDWKLAAQVVDHLVRSGPLQAFTHWRVQDVALCAEPAREARQILVWRDDPAVLSA